MRKFFIYPDSSPLSVVDTHIATVISHPEIFDLTREHIDSVYQKYDEKIGREARARGEILQGLFQQGWIRVRFHERNDLWLFQVDEPSPERLSQISTFLLRAVEEGIDGKSYFPHADLKVFDMQDRPVMSSTVGVFMKQNN